MRTIRNAISFFTKQTNSFPSTRMLLLLVLSLSVVSLLGYLAWYSYEATHRFFNEQTQQFMPCVSLQENLILNIRATENKAFVHHKLSQKYGPVFHTSWLPIMRGVVVTDPTISKKVLLNTQKFLRATSAALDKHPTISRFLGKSVGNTEGELWSKQRRLMNPAFIDNNIFTVPFVRKCRQCINQMAESKNDKGEISVDVKDLMTRMTLDILGETVFGMELGYLSGQHSELLDAYNFLWNEGAFNIWTLLLPTVAKLPTAFNKKVAHSLDVLDRDIYGLINEKRRNLEKIRQELQKEHEQVTEAMILAKLEKKSLLDSMVLSNMKVNDDSNEPTMTDKELRDNTVILFIAGLFFCTAFYTFY